MKTVKSIVIVILGSAVVYFLSYIFGMGVCEVVGNSMEPTYHEGDRVIVAFYEPYIKHIERNMVVVINNPVYHSKDLKRIVAVPGDTIQLGKRVYKLRDNQYFVLGDNSLNSMDSREYGPISKKDILGVVK